MTTSDDSMIPGGFEKRPVRPLDEPHSQPAVPTAPLPRPEANDRARLEREREGGGAPGERKIKW